MESVSEEGVIECEDCGHDIRLGEVSIPQEKEFIKIACSECGSSQKVSLLRIHILQNPEEG